MNGYFTPSAITLALCMAFPVVALTAQAAEPYPALPPSLSTSVTPNILLHVDNSGSMANRPAGATTGPTKIQTARAVAKDLIDKNKTLRWGLFSFDKNSNEKSGVLQAPVGSTQTTLNTAIDALGADTWTPLGEAAVEISRYWAGESSYYGKTKNLVSGKYVSPIQYRCQKNFNIIITDGVSTKDDSLPGIGLSAIPYTSYNSSGVAVTKNFNVCTSTATSSSVTCLSGLEELNATTGAVQYTGPQAFRGNAEDANTYRRSLRDVAMYMYDRDMRAGGNDSDTVSFDDPKFQKQNVATYTVGFAIDDPVLEATAIVGGGKYYTASDQASLSTALSNAVASIVASTSNAGGVATTSEVTTVGNKVFQPVFNPNGWYGELRCYTINSAASNGIGDPCTPNAKAVIPTYTSRNIYSNKVVSTGTATLPASTTTAFDFNDSTGFTAMVAAQKNALGVDAASQKKVINYLRGNDTIIGFRTRPNGLLGDIIDGQPVVVTAPMGDTPDSAYPNFKTTNAARNLVFIGANDGMLHAFGTSNMTELMGYIPSAVYPRLAALKETNYGLSAGTPHAYHVNGAFRQADVKFSTGWKTILAGGLGQGGQGYFAIDTTNAATLGSNSAIKWEWTDVSDADVGYSFPTPLIYNVKTSATTVVPAVILANGYDNQWDDTASGGQKTSAASSALYIMNAETGVLIKKISVSGGAGLSSPAGVDTNTDGILDYVYAGDMNGKVWRFDLTSNDPDSFNVASNPIFDAGPTHPITLRPAVKVLTTGNLVLFGTGKLLTDADRQDTTTQSFYGILDKTGSTPTTALRANLQERTIVDTYTGTTTSCHDVGDPGSCRPGTYRKISPTTSSSADADPTALDLDLLKATETKLGWYLDLPVSSERLVTSPLVFEDKLLFGTGIPLSDQKCLPGGTGWVMALNPLTGSVITNNSKKKFSFIDIYKDGKSTSKDKIKFSSGDAYISGYQKDGIPTELTYVASSSTPISWNTDLGSTGTVIALREANSMAVYRGGTTPKAVGDLYNGTVGSADLNNEKLLGSSTAFKVETTIWRELKN